MIQTIVNANWLPFILVRIEGQHYGCYDGIHRLEEYKRCNVKNVTDDQAIVSSFTSNCGKVGLNQRKLRLV